MEILAELNLKTRIAHTHQTLTHTACAEPSSRPRVDLKVAALEQRDYRRYYADSVPVRCVTLTWLRSFNSFWSVWCGNAVKEKRIVLTQRQPHSIQPETHCGEKILSKGWGFRDQNQQRYVLWAALSQREAGSLYIMAVTREHSVFLTLATPLSFKCSFTFRKLVILHSKSGGGANIKTLNVLKQHTSQYICL